MKEAKKCLNLNINRMKDADIRLSVQGTSGTPKKSKGTEKNLPKCHVTCIRDMWHKEQNCLWKELVHLNTALGTGRGSKISLELSLPRAKQPQLSVVSCILSLQPNETSSQGPRKMQCELLVQAGAPPDPALTTDGSWNNLRNLFPKLQFQHKQSHRVFLGPKYSLSVLPFLHFLI